MLQEQKSVSNAAEQPTIPLPKRAGFIGDVYALGVRAIKSLTRDMESLLPALFIPAFFYLVTLGALQDFVERAPGGLDYKAFQLPTATLFAVTGLSRANVLVLDIQRGYFDRLALTPSNRLALLLGLMVSDLALAFVLTVLVIIIGTVIGVTFATGFAGWIIFILFNLLWATGYNAIPYAIALKTGNPTVVNTSFIIFFPVIFLSPLWIPREFMTGWLQTVVAYNPVTYLLEGLRSLIDGWSIRELLYAVIAISAFSGVTIPFSLWALAWRTRRS